MTFDQWFAQRAAAAQLDRLLASPLPIGDSLRQLYAARPWDESADAFWATVPEAVRAATDLLQRATDKGRHVIARHIVRPSAALLVIETVGQPISTRPSIPALLRKPGYACVKRPERERLGGEATELLWLPGPGLSQEIECWATIRHGDANHRVKFGFRPVVGGWEAWLIGEHSGPGSPDEDRAAGGALGGWLCTFGMLLEAEGAPIEAIPERDSGRGHSGCRWATESAEIR